MGIQNRINPNGDLIKTPARGSLMGNRGILHDADGKLTKKRWTHPNWIYCLPDYRGRKQPINAPGHYTQLFFLDEVTALAAGHRPCGCCQHQRLVEFLDFWAKGNPEHASVVSINSIDKILHRERVTPSRAKVTFRSKLGNLPDGVMVMFPQVKGIYYLFTAGQLKMWSPFGYLLPVPAPLDLEVIVLTPASFVKAIETGFAPAFGGDKPDGPEAPVFQEEWCLKILECLKRDFPLPEYVELSLDFQAVTLVRVRSATGGGICSHNFKGVRLTIAMQDRLSLKGRLGRMAHEYWHAYQVHTCLQPSDPRWAGRMETDAREFSGEYAARFMRDNGLDHLLAVDRLDDYPSRRKRLLIQLEAIAGRHFYSPHLDPSTFNARRQGKGIHYRAPVLVRDGKKKKDHYYLPETIEDEVLQTGHYSASGNEFRIMEALEEILELLEKDHGLKI